MTIKGNFYILGKKGTNIRVPKESHKFEVCKQNCVPLAHENKLLSYSCENAYDVLLSLLS